MPGSCAGKVAVVTGGSRGIGRATALRLAHEGADVALVARDLDGERLGRSLAGTIEEVRATGRRALPVAADLTDASFRRASIIEEVEAELGPVDILVNNAAMSVFKDVVDWNIDKVRIMQEVNVMAPLGAVRRRHARACSNAARAGSSTSRPAWPSRTGPVPVARPTAGPRPCSTR